jgi:hypothetical protein
MYLFPPRPPLTNLPHSTYWATTGDEAGTAGRVLYMLATLNKGSLAVGPRASKLTSVILKHDPNGVHTVTLAQGWSAYIFTTGHVIFTFSYKNGQLAYPWVLKLPKKFPQKPDLDSQRFLDSLVKEITPLSCHLATSDIHAPTDVSLVSRPITPHNISTETFIQFVRYVFFPFSKTLKHGCIFNFNSALLSSDAENGYSFSTFKIETKDTAMEKLDFSSFLREFTDKFLTFMKLDTSLLGQKFVGQKYIGPQLGCPAEGFVPASTIVFNLQDPYSPPSSHIQLGFEKLITTYKIPRPPTLHL